MATIESIVVSELYIVPLNDLDDYLQRERLRVTRTTEWDEMDYRVWTEVRGDKGPITRAR